MTDLSAPHFHDETKAREHLEAVLWPHGPYCPHCGSYAATRMDGDKHRDGLVNCRDCRKQYSVTVGTVFERSHLPLTTWLMANHLMNASKKGISAHQMHRMLNLPYKTAWFMCHRIREAMRDANPIPMGGEGKVIEADEAYKGRKQIPVPARAVRARPISKPAKPPRSGPSSPWWSEGALPAPSRCPS
jgi:transposase-like protein